MTHSEGLIVRPHQIELTDAVRVGEVGIRDGYLDTTTTTKEGSLELTLIVVLCWLLQISSTTLPVDRVYGIGILRQPRVVLQYISLKRVNHELKEPSLVRRLDLIQSSTILSLGANILQTSMLVSRIWYHVVPLVGHRGSILESLRVVVMRIID